MRQATERYELSGIVERKMVHGDALRMCALHGPTRMSALGRALTTKTPNPRRSSSDPTAVVAGGAETPIDLSGDSEILTWTEVCEFASVCVDSVSDGGSGSENGWDDFGGSDGGGDGAGGGNGDGGGGYRSPFSEHQETR